MQFFFRNFGQKMGGGGGKLREFVSKKVKKI